MVGSRQHEGQRSSVKLIIELYNSDNVKNKFKRWDLIKSVYKPLEISIIDSFNYIYNKTDCQLPS